MTTAYLVHYDYEPYRSGMSSEASSSPREPLYERGRARTTKSNITKKMGRSDYDKFLIQEVTMAYSSGHGSSSSTRGLLTTEDNHNNLSAPLAVHVETEPQKYRRRYSSGSLRDYIQDYDTRVRAEQVADRDEYYRSVETDFPVIRNCSADFIDSGRYSAERGGVSAQGYTIPVQITDSPESDAKRWRRRAASSLGSLLTETTTEEYHSFSTSRRSVEDMLDGSSPPSVQTLRNQFEQSSQKDRMETRSRNGSSRYSPNVVIVPTTRSASDLRDEHGPYRMIPSPDARVRRIERPSYSPDDQRTVLSTTVVDIDPTEGRGKGRRYLEETFTEEFHTVKTYKSPKRRSDAQESAVKIPVTIHDTAAREHQSRGTGGQIIRESIREDIYVTRSSRSSPAPQPSARSPPPQGQVLRTITTFDGRRHRTMSPPSAREAELDAHRRALSRESIIERDSMDEQRSRANEKVSEWRTEEPSSPPIRSPPPPRVAETLTTSDVTTTVTHIVRARSPMDGPHTATLTRTNDLDEIRKIDESEEMRRRREEEAKRRREAEIERKRREEEQRMITTRRIEEDERIRIEQIRIHQIASEKREREERERREKEERDEAERRRIREEEERGRRKMEEEDARRKREEEEEEEERKRIREEEKRRRNREEIERRRREEEERIIITQRIKEEERIMIERTRIEKEQKEREERERRRKEEEEERSRIEIARVQNIEKEQKEREERERRKKKEEEERRRIEEEEILIITRRIEEEERIRIEKIRIEKEEREREEKEKKKDEEEEEKRRRDEEELRRRKEIEEDRRRKQQEMDDEMRRRTEEEERRRRRLEDENLQRRAREEEEIRIVRERRIKDERERLDKQKKEIELRREEEERKRKEERERFEKEMREMEERRKDEEERREAEQRRQEEEAEERRRQESIREGQRRAKEEIEIRIREERTREMVAAAEDTERAARLERERRDADERERRIEKERREVAALEAKALEEERRMEERRRKMEEEIQAREEQLRRREDERRSAEMDRIERERIALEERTSRAERDRLERERVIIELEEKRRREVEDTERRQREERARRVEEEKRRKEQDEALRLQEKANRERQDLEQRVRREEAERQYREIRTNYEEDITNTWTRRPVVGAYIKESDIGSGATITTTTTEATRPMDLSAYRSTISSRPGFNRSGVSTYSGSTTSYGAYPSGTRVKIAHEVTSSGLSGLSPYGQHAAMAIRDAREREKKEMSDLNDRLASYIEKVRFLEAQNRKLGGDLDMLRGRWGKDTSSMRIMFESELKEARTVIDDTHRQRSDLENSIKKLNDDLEEYRRKYDETVRARDADRTVIDELLLKLSKFEAEISMLKRKIAHLEEDVARVKKENQKLIGELQKARNDLDQETLNRIDNQNQVQTLLEEIDFVRRVHEQEIKELQSMVSRDTTPENREFFKNELASAIRDIRQEYDQRMNTNRTDIESWYKLKVQEIQTASNRQTMEHGYQKEEVRRLRTQLSDLRGKLADLEGRNALLEKQTQELNYQLEDDHRSYEVGLNDRDAQINKLRDECHALMVELQMLMDKKQTLDAEIAIYRKMLEGEENRAGLRQLVEQVVKTKAISSTEENESVRVVKGESATRTSFQRSAKGNISIHETSPEGHFVVIENTHRSKEEPIGGWKLKSKIDGKREVVFTFPNDFVLRPGRSVKIVAHGHGISAPPDTLVLESEDTWGVGQNVHTLLFNAAGEERATHIHRSSHA